MSISVSHKSRASKILSVALMFVLALSQCTFLFRPLVLAQNAPAANNGQSRKTLPFTALLSGLGLLAKDALNWDAAATGTVFMLVGITDILVQGVLLQRLLKRFSASAKPKWLSAAWSVKSLATCCLPQSSLSIRPFRY